MNTAGNREPDRVALLRNVGRSVRALALATSEGLGGDCIVHALLALDLLREHDPQARLAAGYAAWRIGSAPGAVVAHHPGAVSIESGGVVFHTWVLLAGGRWIFDPTTYQLRRKMELIDESDGGRTVVDIPKDWNDGLVLRDRDAKSWNVVRQGCVPGLSCYTQDRSLTKSILAHPDSQIDPDFLVYLRRIYACVCAGQQLHLVGPLGAVDLGD